VISPQALAEVMLTISVDRYVVLVRDPDGDPALRAYGPLDGAGAAIEADAWVRTYAEMGAHAEVSIVQCEQVTV
jgi:hypothetical protein